MRDDVPLPRRSVLRAVGTASLTAGVGAAATGTAVAAPNDDYETTTGETEPRYGRSDPEQHYVETAYTLPEAKGGDEESPTLFGEVIWPTEEVDGETRRKTDAPVILTYSPYNDVRSPQSEAASVAADGTADYYVPRGYARAVFDVVGCRNSGGCYDYGGYRERQTGAQLVEYLGGEPDAAGNTVTGTDGTGEAETDETDGTEEETDGSDGTRTTRRVGMIGASYDGTTQLAAAVEDPDHLAAIIPQVAIDRWYDYAFGGGVRYFLNNEQPTDEGFDTPLAFDLGFGFLPPANVDDPERFGAATADRFAPCDAAEHTERAYEYDPVYDAFWERRDYRRRAENVNCAVFVEGGWLDHNVKHWDSTRFYEALPADVPRKLVMGQWSHSSSQFEDARDVRHAWFDYWLHGIDTGVMDLPHVDTQVNTGERLQHEHWPPAGTRETVLDLTRADTANGALALRGSRPPSYTDTEPPLTEEEMFASDDSRHNHLKFESAPLPDDLRISGSPLLDLLAVSTADSAHFTPVLYERLPDGSTAVVTRGFLNARNRDGLDASEPVPVGEPYAAPVELWDTDYLVREGHRLGLVVASDNRDWCLNDPDGHPTNEVILGAPGDGGGTTLRLPTSRVPAALDGPTVSGSRRDDGAVFTGGQTDHVVLEVAGERPVRLRDRVPAGWRVLDAGNVDAEATTTREDGSTVVYFDVPPGRDVTVEYFVEAPSGPAATGRYTFGPAEAGTPGRGAWTVVPGTTDENWVVGPSTSP